MNNSRVVYIFYSLDDGANQMRRVSEVSSAEKNKRFVWLGALFVIVPFGANSIEKLSSRAKIENKVQVMCRLSQDLQHGRWYITAHNTDLKVVMQCHDVYVAARYTLQNCYFIPNLG
jgi:hypothetical protein